MEILPTLKAVEKMLNRALTIKDPKQVQAQLTNVENARDLLSELITAMTPKEMPAGEAPADTEVNLDNL